MAGQLDLFGASRAAAEERSAVRHGGAQAAPPAPVASSAPAELSLGQALAAIAELVRDPARWCQGCSARDASGAPSMPGTPAAVRLSAYGAFALLRSAGRINDNVNLRLWFLLNRATPRGEAFARWHDYAHTSHADVLALLASLTESEEP